jgi:predicted RNA binding protein YcfA (HicA-like mRNA interferase family)
MVAFRTMRRREVVRALMSEGCTSLRNVGGHEVWGCPCGLHRAPLPNHSEISAGVVKSIGRQMACLDEGWLS